MNSEEIRGNNLHSRVLFFLIMAWRNAWRQKKRSAVILTTVFFGTLGCIYYIAWFNALIYSMLDSTIKSGIGHLQVRPAGYAENRSTKLILPADLADSKHLPDTFSKTEKVIWAPRFEREAMLRLGGRSIGLMATGVDPQQEKQVTSVASWLREGNFLDIGSESDRLVKIFPAYIGNAALEKLNARLGDVVLLSFASYSGETVSVMVRVQGSFAASSSLYEKTMMMMRLEDLQQIYGRKVSAYHIGIVRETPLAEIARDDLRQQSQRTDYEILSYGDMIPEIKEMLETSDELMDIFFYIMMLGFGLTLLNGILMAVLERTREIGVFRALGSRGWHIAILCGLEAIVLALSGVVLGFIVGGITVLIFGYTGISLGQFAEGMEVFGYIDNVLYPYLTWQDFIRVARIAVVMALLAVIWPVRRAIKMEPVKAIFNR